MGSGNGYREKLEEILKDEILSTAEFYDILSKTAVKIMKMHAPQAICGMVEEIIEQNVRISDWNKYVSVLFLLRKNILDTKFSCKTDFFAQTYACRTFYLRIDACAVSGLNNFACTCF